MTQHENLDRRLARLLGPAEREVSCEQCFELLDALVEHDLQAGPSGFAGMRAHLAGCPACHEEYDSLRELVGLPVEG